MSTLFGGGGGAAATTSTTGDTSKDVEIAQNQLPTDSISDLMFSPTNDFLAVSSWDKIVWIYEVNNSGAVGKWKMPCQPNSGQPEVPLCVAWSKVRISPAPIFA